MIYKEYRTSSNVHETDLRQVPLHHIIFSEYIYTYIYLLIIVYLQNGWDYTNTHYDRIFLKIAIFLI